MPDSDRPVFFFLARRQRLACLQMPKAGSTTFRAAFSLLNHPELTREAVCERKAMVRHPEWADPVPGGDPFLKKCFRFTFTRNPYARFASFYRSKIGKRTQSEIKPHFLALGLGEGMTLEQVLEVVEKHPAEALDPHIMPQNLIAFSAGQLRVDFVGQIEQLDQGMAEVKKRSGVDLELSRLNVTEGATVRDPRESLSEDLRQRLARLYAEDFRLFGYEV